MSTHDQVGGVLGDIGVLGEHRRDRIADIAHRSPCQHRLAVGLERFESGLRGNRSAACRRYRRRSRPQARPASRSAAASIDRADCAMRMVGAHHAHVQLGGKLMSAAKRPAAGDQRRVFQPRDRTCPIQDHLPGALISLRLIFRRHGADGLDDVRVAGAAAEIGRQHVEQVLVADVRLALEHRDGQHQEARACRSRIAGRDDR